MKSNCVKNKYTEIIKPCLLIACKNRYDKINNNKINNQILFNLFFGHRYF